MELNDYREQIDELDDKILSLFKERMGLCSEIACYKAKNNIPTLNKSREREILERVCKDCDSQLKGYTRILFTILFDLSRSYQSKLTYKESPLAKDIENALNETPKVFPKEGTVACQGIEGAYSSLAAEKLIPYSNIIYFKNFEGVFQSVEQGLCEYGILPIENSIHGTVNEVYDLMKNYKFHIIRSLFLRVSHALLAKPGAKLSDIKEIFSHEQAIGQCENFLKALPNVKVTVCENTAVAAKMVSDSDRTDIAAISSPSCAELYCLSILSENIQNSDNNYTRFICISKDLKIFPGANKVSLMLSVPHKPGSLYSMISKFSALGVNLTKLESRPIPGSDFEFLFYFDMEASVYSPEVLSLLSELSLSPEVFVFLGSYSES